MVDEEVREACARGYGRLVDYVETVSGADRQTIAAFFATGMLLNVLAAMEYTLAGDPRHVVGRTARRGLRGAVVSSLDFAKS